MKCQCCINQATDKHHLKTRGAGGSDDDFNILNACRQCHSKIHSLGMTTFANRNESFKKALLEKGWYFDEFQNKWKHPK